MTMDLLDRRRLRAASAGLTALAALAAPAAASGQVGAAASPASPASPAPPQIVETTLELADGSTLRYALSVPSGYESDDGNRRPLVVALHPGGRSEYYGGWFLESIVEPALRSWGAVIVAPDVPDRSWATARSERAVLALVEHTIEDHAIDGDRVLVTGFSMGGRGTWYLASRHPEVFTGAIVVAGAPGDVDLEEMPARPLYLVHSPNDEVVPYEAAEEAYLALAERGHTIEMRVLPGATHFMMGAYIPAVRLAGEWMLERWDETAPR